VLVPLVLLVGGYLIARVLSSVVRRVIHGAGASRLESAERALAGAGLRTSLPDLGAQISFWVVLFLAVSQAATEAQLGLLTDLLEGAVRLAPVIGLGVAIIFIGALAGDRLGRLLGAIAGASIVAFDTMGLATVLPVTAVSLLIAAIFALLVAAAVLASRGVLSNIAAARYVEETYLEGERVLFRQEPAEVQSIGLLATELVTDAGAVIRVPNHLLVDDAA
jgi:small-conductance mechanosensitive channel